MDYGDGSKVQPLALNSDKTFTLSHTYADDGIFVVKVKVSDGASVGSDAIAVVVKNVKPKLSVSIDSKIEGKTLVGTVSFTDPGADSWTATVDYGDGSGVQTLVLSGKTFSISHTYEELGQYLILIAVSDGASIGSIQISANVIEVPASN